MPSESLLLHQSARRRMLDVVEPLASAVKVTLGPSGRNVILELPSTVPLMPSSGVVAKSIELPDPFADMGARLLCKAAVRTREITGNCTITATTPAQAIVAEGVKYVEAGHARIHLKHGIEAAGKLVAEEHRTAAKPCASFAEMRQIATTSASGAQTVWPLVAEAVEQVGKDGAISVEDGPKPEDELDIAEGALIDRGYLSPLFATTDLRAVVLEGPKVLLCDAKISSIPQLLPIVEAVTGAGTSLLVVAIDIEAAALATLAVNNIPGALKSCAVKSSRFGDARTELGQRCGLVRAPPLRRDHRGPGERS